jgi:hypothetical protein
VETAALPNTHDVTENGMAMEEDKRSKPFRRYICGEDSLRIAADEPYCLHRPMCRGRLNVSTHYSLQQVCDDVYRIWDWILTEKFNLAAKSRRNLSAVIVVPDTLDNREVKELLMVVLRDLQFHSAVVFQVHYHLSHDLNDSSIWLAFTCNQSIPHGITRFQDPQKRRLITGLLQVLELTRLSRNYRT